MKNKKCPRCDETLPVDCFRKGAKSCVWCAYSNKAKRARARWSDKNKHAKERLKISVEDFIRWYESQDDQCSYCGLTFAELKKLRIKRLGGYYVSWDIDRIDPKRGYEKRNLALSCFVCNMAKGKMLSAEEARMVGKAVREVWLARLKNVKAGRSTRTR